MNQYHHLIGKEKKEVLEELGQDFNYYHNDNIWYYHIRTNWIGRKKVQFICFSEEIVHKIKIIKYYGKKI